jgi:hypothetical protein
MAHREAESPPCNWPAGHGDCFIEFEEHGQLWIECLNCGAQWSIEETSNGEEFEQVSEGDGYCEGMDQ